MFVYMTPVEHQNGEIDIILFEVFEWSNIENGRKSFGTRPQIMKQFLLPLMSPSRRHRDTLCKLLRNLTRKAVKSRNYIFAAYLVLLACSYSFTDAGDVRFELAKPVVRSTTRTVTISSENVIKQTTSYAVKFVLVTFLGIIKLRFFAILSYCFCNLVHIYYGFTIPI